jgi:hypothetical protein
LRRLGVGVARRRLASRLPAAGQEPVTILKERRKFRLAPEQIL